MESPGDSTLNIEKDREDANHVVKNNIEFQEAIKSAKNGEKIFLEVGKYEAKSLFLCGKNVAIIGRLQMKVY